MVKLSQIFSYPARGRLAALTLLFLGADWAQAEERPLKAELVEREQALQVALARREADLLVRNATILNVFTREWLPAQDIVIAGKRIAWVGATGTWPGQAAKTLDAEGKTVVPGFGESHKHIESSYLSAEYEAALVIPYGNTWTVEGSHEMSNVIGEHNAEYWLKAEAAGSPLKIFPAIGSATPPTQYELGGGYYGYQEMKDFLASDQRVVALGEVMDWTAVTTPGTKGHERIWEMIEATWELRGVVEGHGSGLTGVNEINAFAAAGLSSDHEVKQLQEGLEKLRRGVFLEVRVDTIRILFPYLLEQGLKDWSNVSVTTDDRDVHATQQLGSMDFNIRAAIEAGVEPAIAYTLGSYNTARHFHIDHLVGAIAPGRYADLVFLSDVDKVVIDKVIANGQLASKGKEYLLPIAKVTYPEWVKQTMNVGRALTADDFTIKAPAGRTSVNVALMQPFYFEPDFITGELPVTARGTVEARPDLGINKVAVIDRYHGTAAVSKMFWQNVGPVTAGSALASSQMHDIHNIWVLGNDDQAMALAANTVAGMQGGWVLVKEGKVVAKVQLEIAGLVSQRPVAEVAAEVEALHDAADTLQWLTSPGLPDRMRFAFLTASPWKWQLVAPYEENPGGFVNVTTGETHPVVW
ncbi:adenine deaminase C-terminal domain-containing protein [Halioxenophilus sp. WMMB6]|uniref:adenine deaminase C-terminal domain-containing protein n=1 Tax=Halioxenophilus sp. WMMB6 TaxID=3073815 RepID=UPI00295E773F|nr:adenine deaminase C-terminal domain-containing protein [Halioxenophilus sp. WMMB6]